MQPVDATPSKDAFALKKKSAWDVQSRNAIFKSFKIPLLFWI